MTELVMGLGILCGLAYHELIGLSPGGIVAPAYLAVFFDQPARVAGTFVVSLGTYVLMAVLTRTLFLYGRRRFGLTLAMGFLLRWAWDASTLAAGASLVGLGFQAIGFIVPGLIANDMDRQGVVRTWASLLIVAAVVRLAILALQGLRWL